MQKQFSNFLRRTVAPSIIFSFLQLNAYAEDEKKAIDNLLTLKEAEASVAKPQLIQTTPLENNLSETLIQQKIGILDYLNKPLYYREDKEGLKREWDETFGAANPFKYYFWFEGEKERLEDKYLSFDFDKKRSDDIKEDSKKTGLSKIKSKMDESGFEIKASFYEHMNKEKAITLNVDRVGKFELKYALKF